MPDSSLSYRKIRKIMNKKVKTVTKSATLKKVAEIMAKYSISCVVVIERKKPIGVITERDIIKKVSLKGLSLDDTKANDIMSTPVYTVDPDADLIPTGRLMKKKKIRRFPVTDKKGNLVGLVTETDILEGIIDLVKHLDWKLVSMKISVAEYLEKLKTSKNI